MFVCLFVCLSVCLFLKRVSGNSYTVENASNAALVPRSPEMEPPLAAVGSATVAVLSQSSGVAAIFGHEAGSRGLLIALFTCCCTNNSAVASANAVRE